MICFDNCSPCRKKCSEPCGCPEPVFSVEAMPDDPDILRFNVNGKSVWYDFSPVTKHGETATTLTVDDIARTLDYQGEKSDQSIPADELGAILHLTDLGDVDGGSVTDNGILNYRKKADCGEGCEGISNGWVSTNPVAVGGDSLEYILGSDGDGAMASLMPPATTNRFSYLSWAAQDKVKWTTPKEVTTIPDDGTYRYPLYLDPRTGEIVVYKEAI